MGAGRANTAHQLAHQPAAEIPHREPHLRILVEAERDPRAGTGRVGCRPPEHRLHGAWLRAGSDVGNTVELKEIDRPPVGLGGRYGRVIVAGDTGHEGGDARRGGRSVQVAEEAYRRSERVEVVERGGEATK